VLDGCIRIRAVSVCIVRPNRPAVLDEAFDGEAVLVNLETGRYYALDRTATRWWMALEAGMSFEALVAALPDAGVAELVAFVVGLDAEQLVRLEGELPSSGLAAADAIPRWQVFDDMEDLLRLDPIHDIELDGSGWPKTA
jgi:hypothetical protein